MVKFLLLTLALGLAEAADISGDWHTIAIASSNVGKITKGGPLRLYERHLQCLQGCEVLAKTFYVHLNGQCQKIIMFTKHVGNGVYNAQYEGDNNFQLVKQTDDFLVFYNENRDAKGQLSKMIFVLGKGDNLDAQQEEKLVDFAASKGIPAENIENVIATDVCPQ